MTGASAAASDRCVGPTRLARDAYIAMRYHELIGASARGSEQRVFGALPTHYLQHKFCWFVVSVWLRRHPIYIEDIGGASASDAPDAHQHRGQRERSRLACSNPRGFYPGPHAATGYTGAPSTSAERALCVSNASFETVPTDFAHRSRRRRTTTAQLLTRPNRWHQPARVWSCNNAD